MFLTGMVLYSLSAAVLGPPAPSLVESEWQLKFTFEDPQRITLVLPGDVTPTTFWYLIYRVENQTGRDISFYPSAEIVTATLDVVPAGTEISPSVYDAIRHRHRVTHPFLLEPRKVIGTLRQGEDNAKASVVVFRQFDLEDNEFTVYFSGLSGEIQHIPNPAFEPDSPEDAENPRLFTLRKTLAIKYHLPGDPQSRKEAEPVRVSRDWVLR